MANHPSGKSYSAATIRTYASAIKSVVLESGIMPASMPGRLSSQVRAGVQALHHGASRTRLPLTIGVLEEIYPCFDQSKRIDRVTFAIISTEVHGLFRLGELCPTTLEQEFFPRRADYSVVEEDGVALSRIFLHRSKTDKLHQGISVSVPHNSRTTSAHRALVELFLEPAPNRVLTLTSDPLFPDSGNRPILRAFLINRNRASRPQPRPLRGPLVAPGWRPEPFRRRRRYARHCMRRAVGPRIQRRAPLSQRLSHRASAVG